MDDEKDEMTAQIKRRVKNNSLYQQQISAWRPLVTPTCISWIFVVVAILFLTLGAVILDQSAKTLELTKRYDDKCGNDAECTITLKVEEDMKGPIFFYYKLVNFYQNHRSYVMDYDIQQLQGDVDDTSSCSVEETKTKDGKSTYPCGLIANSFFNDVFTVYQNGRLLEGNEWDGSDISWESDRNTKFKGPDGGVAVLEEVNRNGTNGNRLPLPDDQNFQVWFRVAGLPRFNKLYRKIGMDLKKGDELTITIQNNFDVRKFNGEKHVFLSQVSWLGGSNFFLGSCYIIVGSLCAIYAVLMLSWRAHHARPLGKMEYYEWTGLGRVVNANG